MQFNNNLIVLVQFKNERNIAIVSAQLQHKADQSSRSSTEAVRLCVAIMQLILLITKKGKYSKEMNVRS